MSEKQIVIPKKLVRKPEENEEQYIWRLGQAKDNGVIKYNWNEIAEFINMQFRDDVSDYKSEAAYRKVYQCARRFFDSNVFTKYDENDMAQLDELTAAKYELVKEKQKVSDERTKLNKVLRDQARRESFMDIFVEKLNSINPLELEYDYSYVSETNGNNDLLIHLSDIHAGIGIDNWCNTFDIDILRQRLTKYLDRIFEIQEFHKSQNAHVVIGEIISGLIHDALRIENNENVIEQFIISSSLISFMLSKMSEHFEEVHVYVTPGNHSRLTPNKEKNLDGENLDLLLPHYLKASLQNFNNVYIDEDANLKGCDIVLFRVREQLVAACHGDKDKVTNVVQRFTMMLGEKPDIILMGHRHTNSLTTVYDTKVIQSGCVSGTDSFALSHRLKNRAEQTVSVIDDTGLVCLYDVKID